MYENAWFFFVAFFVVATVEGIMINPPSACTNATWTALPTYSAVVNWSNWTSSCFVTVATPMFTANGGYSYCKANKATWGNVRLAVLRDLRTVQDAMLAWTAVSNCFFFTSMYLTTSTLPCCYWYWANDGPSQPIGDGILYAQAQGMLMPTTCPAVNNMMGVVTPGGTPSNVYVSAPSSGFHHVLCEYYDGCPDWTNFIPPYVVATGTLQYAPLGTTVIFACVDSTFTLVGASSATCTTGANGQMQWNQLLPTCIPKNIANFLLYNCNFPGATITAYTSPSAFAASAQSCAAQCYATASCIAFQYWIFKLSSNTSCTLLSTSIQTGNCNCGGNPVGFSYYLRAVCTVTQPANGVANYTGSLAVTGGPCFVGLCTVLYTCNTGYVLDGPQSVECTGDGSSVGVLPNTPTCVLLTPVSSDCMATPPAKGAATMRNMSQYDQNLTTCPINVCMVEYSCDAGYVLSGPSSVLCVDNSSGVGVLSNVPTLCTIAGQCPKFTVENGFATMYSNAIISTGSVAYWTCDTGYVSSGDSVIVCSTSSQWSWVNQPQCTYVLDTIINASSSLASYVVPAELSLTDVRLALASMTSDEVPYILAGLTPAQIRPLGYNLTDIVVGCSFSGAACRASDITFATQDGTFGNCYTFNPSGSYVEFGPGEEQGVYMAFNVQQEEYLNISPAAGMVLSVHSPKEPVIPLEMGDYIAPGYFTQLLLTRLTISRIDTPRSVCVNNVSELAPSTPYYYYTGAYSSEACVQSALQSQIIHACGCATPMYGIPAGNGTQLCQLAEMPCVTNFTGGTRMSDATAAYALVSGDCPQLCKFYLYLRETQYEITRVFGRLTTASASSYCVTAAAYNMTCEDFVSQNLAIVRLYYKQLYHLTYTEHMALTINQLVAAIGGLMGLSLGMSVISWLELACMVWEALTLVCAKVFPTKTSRRRVTGQDLNTLIDLSTIHGFRRTGSSNRHRFERLCFLVCLVGAACGLFVQIADTIENYVDYQTYVDISITEEPLTFPAVTFCNLNPYKKSLIQHLSPAQAALNAYVAASQRLG